MEESNNLTAERSLEIITEQIAQSRRAVSKSTGQMLFVGGLCTMGMAIAIGLINYFCAWPLGHLLWFALPLVIWLVMRSVRNMEHAHAPESFVATMVSKTWWTFAALVIGFFFLGSAWNFLIFWLSPPSVAISQHVNIAPVIILLMAMAISITGHILKRKWLVWFGIIGGLVVAFGDYVHVSGALLARFYTPRALGLWHFVSPCMSIFLFSFIGLTLPGWMLKKQK